MPHQKEVDTGELVKMYTVQHLTLDQIGKLIGMTRQGAWKRLKKAGIAAAQGERVMTSCFVCGLPFVKFRKKWIGSIRHFCSEACYGKHMENPDYNPSRNGQMRARLVVSKYFRLSPKHVVHHWDSDCEHNLITNLAVFACQADHCSFERGGAAKPIWDGRSVAVIS